MKCISFAINLKGKQISQYKRYTFNSMVNFNGIPLGANDNGLFSLTGDTDTGDLIEAELELALTDLGIKNPKKLRYFYIGFESSGDLELNVTVDDRTARPYTILANKMDQQRTRVPIGRDGRGRYWSFNIKNTGGTFFAIDSMQVLPIVSNEGHV